MTETHEIHRRAFLAGAAAAVPAVVVVAGATVLGHGAVTPAGPMTATEAVAGAEALELRTTAALIKAMDELNGRWRAAVAKVGVEG